MTWEYVTLSREDLNRDVWVEPVQAVARRLQISGTALKKICWKLSVPTPPNGYWAKKSAGQAVAKPELPKLVAGEPDRHQLTIKRTGYSEAQFSAGARAATARERTVGAAISVPDVLQVPHPLSPVPLGS